MKNSSNPFIRSLSAGSHLFNARPLILAVSIAASVSPLWAVNDLYWDSDDTNPGGSSGDTAPGTWGVDIFWNPNQFGGGFGPLTALTGSLNDVHFSADTDVTGTYAVSIDAAQTANSVIFEEGSVTLSGGASITLGGGGEPNPGLFFASSTLGNTVSTPLILAANSTFANDSAGTQTINGGVTGTFNLTVQNNNGGVLSLSTGPIDNAGTITNNGTGLTETLIGAAIGSNVTQVIQNSPSSLLNLGGASSFGSLFIKAGTVRGAGVSTTPTFFGAGTITLGDTAPSIEPATLRMGGAIQTYTNPIVLGAGTTGTLLIVNNNISSAVTFTGGLTGTNNVTLTSSSAAGPASLNFTTNPVDISGTLTNENLLTAGPVSISSGIGTNVTGVIQNSAGSAFVVSGTNTYNSPTSINLGNFTLADGGSLAGTTITAAAGATFQVSGDSTIGTTGSPSVTIVGGPTGTGGIFSLLGGVINTVNIDSATPGATVLTMGGGVGDPGQLHVDFGATADKIVLGSGLLASIGTGGVEVSINSLGGLDGSPQTLISAPGGGLNSGGGFVLNPAGNFGGNTFSLNNTGTVLSATAVANPAQPVLYFQGSLGGNWNTFANGNANNSNWTTDAAGTTDGLNDPDANTDVHFYAANATIPSLATVLGQDYTIKSLTMDGGALADPVSIASGGGTLTIAPSSPATGVISNSGAGTLTISAPVVLGGSQTWTNDSSGLSGLISTTGSVTGTANLTLAANGTAGITFANSAIGISGTITNSGSGTGAATFSGIGNGVTAINQTSNTSPFTITATAGFAINGNMAFTSTGAATLSSASAMTGTGNLTLLANSSGNVAQSGSVNIVGTVTVSGNGSGLHTVGSIGADVGNVLLSGGGATTATITAANNTGTIINSGNTTGVSTISGAIGTNVTGIFQNSPSSQLTLTGTSTFTSGLTIRAGTVSGSSGLTPFGAASSVITIGDSTFNLPATLRSNLANTSPVGNPIVLATGVTAPLTITSPNTGSQNTFTGGVTGNNNLILSATSTGGMAFTTSAIDNVGTLTSSGIGSGTTTISAVIGSNVTDVTQNGTSPLTLSGPADNTYTGLTTLSSGTLRLDKDDGFNAIPGNLSITGGSLRLTVAKNNTIGDGATVSISGGTYNGTAITVGSAAQNETFANLTMTGGSFNSGGLGSTLAITGSATLSGTANLCVVSGTIASFGSLSLTDISAQTNNNSPLSSFFLNGNNTTQTSLSIGAGGLTLNNSVVNLRLGVNTGTLGSKVVLNGDVTTNGTLASFIRQDTNATFDDGSVALDLGSVGAVTRTFTVGGGGADLTVSVPVTFGSATTAGLAKQGAGTMTLSRVNTYNGATTVGDGTLLISGTGSINNSTDVTINGGTAKFVHASSVAMTPSFTLSQGTLDGTGTITNAVNVDAAGAASTKVITAGNGGAGTLTIGTLTFAGSATVNVAQAGAPNAVGSTKIATTNLNSDGAPNSVVLNVTNSGIYTAAPYDLITFTTLGAGDFPSFTLGTVSGIGARQSVSLQSSATAVQLVVNGSAGALVWTGDLSDEWSTGVLAAPKNWLNGGSPDDFLFLDAVTFDDSSGSFDVDIAGDDVRPFSVTFSNATQPYTLGSAGGFDITGVATLTKSGAASVTINNANTYSGATTIQSGTIINGINNALPVGSALVLGNNTAGAGATHGTLDLTNFSQTVPSLSVQGDSTTVTPADTILIGSGRTLTVNGSVSIGLSSGAATPKFTATGGGALAVNGTSFSIGTNTTGGTTVGNNATVDLSGLASVNVTLSGNLNIGDNSSGNSSKASSLLLPTTGAGNTTITAAAITVGTQGRNGTGQVNFLTLGSGANVFNTNAFNVGGVTGTVRDAGSVTFANASGTLQLRNSAGTGRAAMTMSGGGSASNTGIPRNSTFNVSGHNADLLIGTLTIGDMIGAGTSTNVFSFDTGLLDATTINIGRRASTVVSANAHTYTVNFGSSPASTGAVTVGTGGIVLLRQASTVVGAGPVNSTLNILGGTVTVGGNISQVVDPAGAPRIGTLNLNGGSLNMSGNRIGGPAAANNIDVLTFASGTLQNVAEINNGAGLTKTTAGTLILQGTNTYTGPTTINQGTLLANSATSVGASSPVSVVGGALGGTGTVLSAVTVGAAGAIAPGVTIGALAVASADLTAGGTLAIDLNDAATPKVDTLNTAGVLNVTNGKLTFSVTGTPTQPSYTIATAASVTGTFPLANITGLPSGYTLVYSATDIRLVAGGPTGFAAYMANPAFGLAIGDQDPNDDPEFDGIQNLAEYVLNGNPSVSDTGILPAILDASGLNLVITFTRRDDSEIDVAQVLQYGNDLSGWIDVVIPPSSQTVSGVTFTINETPPTAGTDFVTASIPKDGDTLLFARLKFTK